MSHGANAVHLQLRKALEDYIKTQYFGKIPILLSAMEGQLDREGVLYQKPYIESSPAYKMAMNGIQASNRLPQWMKGYFNGLSEAKLGVYQSPFCHQVSALEAAYEGQDLFVATGTGSGKTECFMWPLMAKLATEARNQSQSWQMRGVRAIIMYPMNALVSDQISRLRRLIGDPEHKFVRLFRATCGKNVRRPQFGMYTGRTPYAGKEPKRDQDQQLEKTYASMVNPETEEDRMFLQRLIEDGKLPAKESFTSFLEKLHSSKHIPDEEDAELVTRFEMQQFCPDILITNYSMLEYMLLRPRENKIWADTKEWLDIDTSNKLLFVIDEAHMYRGSAGGEVSLLIRRLFHRLDIDRNRVQFILTTASMPDKEESDRIAVRTFANALTASDNTRPFVYLTGEREEIATKNGIELPFSKFKDAAPENFEGEDIERLKAINEFFSGICGVTTTFVTPENAYQWLYDHLAEYKQFSSMFQMCRGTAVSLQELAESIFPKEEQKQALHAVSVMLAIAPLAKSSNGSVLFPARMHMLFRGINGVYACSNPQCKHSHTEDGLTLGEIYFSDGRLVCKECESAVYELYNDRRCGSIFFKGYVLTKDFEQRRRTYLWHYPGSLNDDELKEIHLFIPSSNYRLPLKQGVNKIRPCYLDVQSGFVDFGDDTLDGKSGIRTLYYSSFSAKGRPNVLTFPTCPHCQHELSKAQLTSFSTRGNQSFFNLIKAQFESQPAVPGKTGDMERLPNEGRKVLLFSDSRQRAAKLARDMSDASDMTAARQLAALAMQKMEQETNEQSLNALYGFFAMAAAENHVQIFHDQQRTKLLKDGANELTSYQKCKRRGFLYSPKTMDNAPNQMKEQLLRFYCGGYNTLIDSALSWIEPTNAKKWEAIDALEDVGIDVSEEEFLDFFNAWILFACDTYVILGHTISDDVRSVVRHNYAGYGMQRDWKFSTVIKDIMGWTDADTDCQNWKRILQDVFMDEGQSANEKYYVDLTRIKPRFDLNHPWYRCERCSELTPFLLKGRCPSCGHNRTHKMAEHEIDALDFWIRPVREALQGMPIRVIDTEEHTAQLSHKDQRDELWSKTEQYELRFQDFLQAGESSVDILSSTTTMEVGIDIGSLVAVGLRNIPPMRENYQQRAGRAGRRGSSLSTIVTFCEDGPHDSLYFANPVPMFRGDPRKPWIDVAREKIVQRHLGMVAMQAFLRENSFSMDAIPATVFLDEYLQPFFEYLNPFSIPNNDILVPLHSVGVLQSYKEALRRALLGLKQKRDDHPELYDTDDSNSLGQKMLLDALYEEGIIPTYSFPKNVVSTYISGTNGKIRYQVERGLDIAIGEYAPGRAIVVDKTTYQIGGLFCPGSDRTAQSAASPARPFIQDANYLKNVLTCEHCGWFGLREDNFEVCPFCGNTSLKMMLPMLRPWGFAPRNATSIETAQLNEEYTATQQPVYSTLPEAVDVSAINGCANIRMAIRPNQRIIMLNRGKNGKGFMVCCDCGAAMPGDNEVALKDLMRPYRSKFNKGRCRHNDAVNVNLGYDFVTDMLVLEFQMDRNLLDVDVGKGSWINRAGQSLAEAVRLAACDELDIEFTELVTGFRVRQSSSGDFVDIYLYDSLSSGAGYAVSMGEYIPKLLEKARDLLSKCTCDVACYKCLKHYRNQYVHSILDRNAALNLLDWGEHGIKADELSAAEQRAMVKSMAQILRLSGIGLEINEYGIGVTGKSSRKKLVIYPAMWAKPKAEDIIFISDAQLKYSKPYALKEISDSV